MSTKIIVMTDVHANLPARQAVLDAVRQEGYDAIFHTGDDIYIASVIFHIALGELGKHRGYDGHFTQGPLRLCHALQVDAIRHYSVQASKKRRYLVASAYLMRYN